MLSKVYNTEFYLFSENKLIFILLFAYILRLGLGLGKLRYLPGGPGGLPPGLGFGLGKLRKSTGGPGACHLG